MSEAKFLICWLRWNIQVNINLFLRIFKSHIPVSPAFVSRFLLCDDTKTKTRKVWGIKIWVVSVLTLNFQWSELKKRLYVGRAWNEGFRVEVWWQLPIPVSECVFIWFPRFPRGASEVQSTGYEAETCPAQRRRAGTCSVTSALLTENVAMFRVCKLNLKERGSPGSSVWRGKPPQAARIV